MFSGKEEVVEKKNVVFGAKVVPPAERETCGTRKVSAKY